MSAATAVGQLDELTRQRNELAKVLRGFLAEFGDKTENANVRAARDALAALSAPEARTTGQATTGTPG